jgi:hypothetical protein
MQSDEVYGVEGDESLVADVYDDALDKLMLFDTRFIL